MGARICLNMIVKDEAAIIERSCRAMVAFVDCYVICDTGSSDDTVAIIERAFAEAGIPGEIHHTTFVNFEQARNEALDAARSSSFDFDYILLCDADMELTESDPGWREILTGPAYMIRQRAGTGLEYPNVRLVHRHHSSRYVGVTHEYLDVGGVGRPPLPGLLFLDHAAGSSRAEKYERDIRLLRGDLDRDPDNPRTVFYLANSYFENNQLDEAVEWYWRRIELAGYQDERYVSMFRIGLAMLRQGDEPGFWRQMLLTHDTFPQRAEPLHELALHAQREKRHHLAWCMATLGLQVPKPEHALFVQTDVYDWRLDDIVAVSLYWKGQRDEARVINERLLDIVPEPDRPRIEANLAYCRGETPVA